MCEFHFRKHPLKEPSVMLPSVIFIRLAYFVDLTQRGDKGWKESPKDRVKTGWLWWKTLLSNKSYSFMSFSHFFQYYCLCSLAIKIASWVVLLHHTLKHMSFFFCLQWSSVCCLCPSPFKADKPEMDSLHTEHRIQKAWGLERKYSHSISKWMRPTLEVESPFFKHPSNNCRFFKVNGMGCYWYREPSHAKSPSPLQPPWLFLSIGGGQKWTSSCSSQNGHSTVSSSDKICHVSKHTITPIIVHLHGSKCAPNCYTLK